MPQVPYVPYPTAAEPSTGGTPKLSINTPGEAFGTGLGKAISSLGEGLERDSDKIFHRAIALQDIQNETMARNADIENSKAMAKADIDFRTKEGVNASPEALMKHLDGLQQIFNQTRAGLPNDDARRKFDGFALSTYNRSMFDGMRHASIESKKAYVNSAKAQADLDADTLYHAGSDGTVLSDKAISDYLEKGRKSGAAIAAAQGADEVTTTDIINRITSKHLSHYLTGLAQSNPQLAIEMAKKYEKDIHGEDLPRLQKSLELSAKTIEARIEVDKETAPLWHPNPDVEPPSYKEMLDRTDKRSEELHPGDAVFRDAMRARLEGSFNSIKRITKNTEYEQAHYLDGAIAGFTNPAGKVPTTLEELFVDPKAQAYYQAQGAAGRRKTEAALAHNAKDDYIETPQRMEEFQRIMSMGRGYASDEDREAFLAIKNRELELPLKRRMEIWQLQQKVKEGMAKEPHINEAMRTMFPDLIEAKVTPALDKNGYYRFQGVLGDWMSDYIRQYGRSPKREEILETGRRMLYERVDKATFEVFFHHIPLFDKKVRMFKDVPKDEIAKAIDQHKAENPDKRAPTEEEMARYLIRSKLHAMEKKPKVSEE